MATLYRDVRVERSTLDDTCLIGDRSIVLDSTLGAQVRLQRDNYIQSSTFGSYSYTGQSTRIFATAIGRFCSISWHVSLGPSEHATDTLTTHPLNHDASWGVFGQDDLPVTKFDRQTKIGHDVWIGCGAFVRKGVTIADGCIIGANAVVVKDTEPYGIYAGNPAHLIRSRFQPEIVKQLRALPLYAAADDQLLHIMQKIRAAPLTRDLLKEIAGQLG